MIGLLSRLFIKDRTNYSSQEVRTSYGMLCSILGIALNALLFAFKFIAGVVSGSVAMTADAFNNLSDSGSSVVTLTGFRLASKKPDKDHPFGHGRFEYISALIVAFVIFLMGFELIKTSIDKIINPGDIKISIFSVSVLVLSVIVKLYMAYYNAVVGKKINSSAMKATAIDSLSDTFSTAVVLVSMVVSQFTPYSIDGICGLVVALFILKAGFSAAKETIDPLLGQPPSKEFVEKVHGIVMSFPEVKGIHDLVVHDYGPGRVMVSLHAEVSEKADLLETHDVIDNIEKYLCEALGCDAVIHMDPISDCDEFTNALKQKISDYLAENIHKEISVHDFRTVKGQTHTNIIFDVVLPYEIKYTDEEIRRIIREYLETFEDRLFAVVTVDRSYI